MPALAFFDDIELFEALKPSMKYEHFPKGCVIERSGEISKRLFIIEKGLVRVFYRKHGKEISCHFAKEGEIMTGIDSFFTGKPSIYTSDALEDTYCYSINQEQLQWSFDNHPKMDRFGREFITSAYVELVERYNSLVYMSAEERYRDFINRHADLLNRVPLGYISSFLGMSQETLSRIRAKKDAIAHRF
ncbi:MAG: Crp/Fnr family transcriptional regulator [Marinoscillum sp.]